MYKKSGLRKGQNLERGRQHGKKPLSPGQLPPHQLQQQIGNRAVTSLLQAKLTVGQPNDRYEQEADRTAAAIIRMPTPPAHNLEDDEAERQTTPQLQAQGSAIEIPDGFETQLAQHQASGQPLPTSTRDFMEPRFGADFSHVRIHQTPALADAIHAKAFTHGNHIYFNAGQYNPGTHSGKVLLAHELTHVLQQGSGLVPSVIPRQPAIDMPGSSPSRGNAHVEILSWTIQALNLIADRIQSAKAREALNRQIQSLSNFQGKNPELGILLIFTWQVPDLKLRDLSVRSMASQKGSFIFLAHQHGKTKEDAFLKHKSAAKLYLPPRGFVMRETYEWLPPLNTLASFPKS